MDMPSAPACTGATGRLRVLVHKAGHARVARERLLCYHWRMRLQDPHSTRAIDVPTLDGASAGHG
eukprot:8743190-Pyramimonas_sp.AAC.2